jgi:hypothetical protein
VKFKGVTPEFKCSLADVPGHVCSPERARWPASGFWSDVCQAAMDLWQTNMNANNRHPWTGRKKEGGD